MNRLLLAVSTLLLGVSARAQADDTVGRWTISGDGGTCGAGTQLGNGQLLMIYPRPPGGENSGGIMFGVPKDSKIADGPVVIELTGQGSVTGKHNAIAYAQLSGYWLPFGSPAEIDKYPDSWQLTATKDGEVLVDQPVTEFKAAVAALGACGKPTG